MRLASILVFDQIVRGTTEAVSAPEHNDALGKADELTYEFEVEDAGGTSPTLSARHLHSNSGRRFIGLSNLVTNQALSPASSALPYRDIKTQSGPLGALGQVGITLGGTDPWARVRVWACTRSK